MSIETEEPVVKHRWFTFGYDHEHVIMGVVYNHECVVRISAPDPRAIMFEKFGRDWSMEYPAEPNLKHYPRGVLEL